ncbi:hypothetical protein [Mesorhizobium australafricanum]|uniref:Uncharacterized protein n=1 Tax=Mesorhizobium australafricanum TaxID=3072311 RepID=A0ABU4X542_9HYPH|nr:hypothetical protein [Mesorhizobium sp. VK3E]MDX8443413.1 hypothetical protein [Mesorhizobium sp. VK3E]
MLAIFTFDSRSCWHSSANAAPLAGKLTIAQAIAIETGRMETSFVDWNLLSKGTLRPPRLRVNRPHAVFWVLHL